MLSCLAILSLACEPAAPNPENELELFADDDLVQGFDDHSVPALDSIDTFEHLAKRGPSSASLKFVITQFARSAHSIRWLDSTFYTMHDEWYWFRLVNGQSCPGSSTAPVQGMSFSTLPEIVDWAAGQQTLPLDLRFVSDGRLYSPEFYTLALKSPRVYGVGSLLRVDALEARPAMWVFELEYGDAPSHAELVEFFDQIMPSVPGQIADELKWVVRSPVQETLARQMEAAKLLYWDRIVRYRELAVPGAIEVYNDGLRAGRLKAIRSAESGLESTRSSQILLLEDVPDYLPPAAGLVTAVPQTPLAHINVLARNRGIPNAYLGGLFDDISLEQMHRVEAPVIVRARAPEQLDIVAMTEAEYRSYLELGQNSSIAVDPVDPQAIPYTYTLDSLDPSAIDQLRPVIGGKASGFLGLLAPDALVLPENAMVITVRAYIEHMLPLQPYLNAMLADASFKARSEIQFLLLEGSADFDLRYQSPSEQALKDEFIASHPQNTLLGELLRYGGLKRLIQQRPLSTALRGELETALRARFADFSPRQGLRFRSSSSVEDIEGFNGAGLYSSNTGFLDPSVLSDPNDQKQTIEWALKKTWASYWGFEGFTERQLERIDHLSGNMALLVHARFDDALEVSNGVFTFTLLPPRTDQEMVLEVNVQLGAESVTNPTPGLGALPEVVRVVLLRGTQLPRIERLARSSLSPQQDLLSDAKLLELFDSARAVSEAWLQRENAKLPTEQRSSTLTLDFEFREMAEGWPAFADGRKLPQRLVIKQARTLEPGLRGVPSNLLALPIPRDLLARARRVERIACNADSFSFVTTELNTDPGAYPDFGYSIEPFSSFFSLTLTRPLPALSLDAGHRVVYNYGSYDAEHPELATDAVWSLRLRLSPSAASSARLELIELSSEGRYRLEYQGQSAQGSYQCERSLLRATPEDYLLSLLKEKGY